MQCGFACLEAGSIRTKNVTNIIMKNMLDIFISCLAYWMVGYAFAYGRGNPFIGLTYWAGAGIPKNKYSHWFFQFVFAATAATIVSGAVAERCNFVAYIVYSAVISGVIYPVVSHWVWAKGGWLIDMGYTDFAGSGAVHLLGGACSLIAAMLLGPRIGRFERVEMPGHSIPLVGIGGLILITGFLAFNGGSLGTITTFDAGSSISMVISNTVVGGTSAAGIALIAGRTGLAGPKSWNFSLTLNGALTGMVGVLPFKSWIALKNYFKA
ncbi:UNVERIFIED_CONTAM: hypothetical protein PYX00_005058 [Menopon gallinae]|uniref:Ammonium transporter AmtB-like domain-containing protein n=1 Tax=Menopon gallinae TaxID=328185 RepID=A0AAW2HPP0_9NEOP